MDALRTASRPGVGQSNAPGTGPKFCIACGTGLDGAGLCPQCGTGQESPAAVSSSEPARRLPGVRLIAVGSATAVVAGVAGLVVGRAAVDPETVVRTIDRPVLVTPATCREAVEAANKLIDLHSEARNVLSMGIAAPSTARAGAARLEAINAEVKPLQAAYVGDMLKCLESAK